MADFRWYVAQALPGLESTAIYHLTREGITSFAPVVSRDRAARLFPGYVFVELESPDEAGVINRTRGIHKILPIHAVSPLPLPRAFVDELRERQARGEFDERSDDAFIERYVPEESVPIIAGTYAGHCGKMVRYHKGSMVVLLTILGAERQVPIPAHCAARIQRAA